MKLKIGKRYRWSPYRNGKKKWKNGILSEIITGVDGVRYGIFITRDNEEWQIPLSSIDLEEWKED